MRDWASVLVFVGAALGLTALFLNWTGDGRGIDYIQPSGRFERGYILPTPLSILPIVAIVGIGVTFLSGTAHIINLRWGSPYFLWLGGIGGLVMALFPIGAHLGYRYWMFYEEFDGSVVFFSSDWGAGLWVALVGGGLAVAGTVWAARLAPKRQ